MRFDYDIIQGRRGNFRINVKADGIMVGVIRIVRTHGGEAGEAAGEIVREFFGDEPLSSQSAKLRSIETIIIDNCYRWEREVNDQSGLAPATAETIQEQEKQS